MRTLLPILVLLPFGAGCDRFLVRTQSTVTMGGPVDTHVTANMPPVNPTAGRMQTIIVQTGAGSGRVAIVDVDGLILNTPFSGPLSLGENPVALFREKLDAIECDPCVRAVVLRVNSPGGGVAASMTMRRDLERFKERTRLPVVACLMDLGTGGAYYLASAADQVVAAPAGVTGGVGVILNLFNLQDLMAQFNVIPQAVKSGELVDIGSSSRPLRPAERELLQAMADEFHLKMRADILRSRPVINEKKKDEKGTPFDGRILTGSQALARGFADHTGDLDEAIRLAAAMGAVPADRPQVVLYRRSNDPAHSIYAVTANIPLQGAGLLPNLPGLDRSKIPTFLSMWQPELTMEKLGGK